jgi:hypothetical protein
MHLLDATFCFIKCMIFGLNSGNIQGSFIKEIAMLALVQPCPNYAFGVFSEALKVNIFG